MGIESGNLDKVVVHVGDLMISTSFGHLNWMPRLTDSIKLFLQK